MSNLEKYMYRSYFLKGIFEAMMFFFIELYRSTTYVYRYENVPTQKCKTVYDQQCKTVYDTKYETTYVNECSITYESECQSGSSGGGYYYDHNFAYEHNEKECKQVPKENCEKVREIST